MKILSGIQDLINKVPVFLPVSEHLRWKTLAEDIISSNSPEVAYNKIRKIYDDLGYLDATYDNSRPAPSLDNLDQVQYLDPQ